MNKILIIEDNLVFSQMLCNWLEQKGWQTEQVSSVNHALELLAATDADVILSDIRLPDGDGMEILEWMNVHQIHIPFVVMTEYAEVPSAVRAIKLGAEDYLKKTFVPGKLYEILNRLLRRKPKKEGSIFHRRSVRIREVECRAGVVAAADTVSVLIRGENGTGKEYIAHLIHELSPRKEKPFVPVDCGSISKELAASEFFGHVRGAFTGALNDKTGLLHEAEGGTLFLDEIGNLPHDVQTLLLRTLQERTYRPVGGGREITADIRIVAATNEHLEKAIREGRFRQDLFYRLNEFTIFMPLLAECREDIIPLAEFFREQSCHELKRHATGFSVAARKKLENYTWPGNVRELKNKIREAVILTKGELIEPDVLSLEYANEAGAQFALKNEMEERERIVKALEMVNGNKTRAAILLQIDHSTLYEKIEKYGIGTQN
jgi:two-component system response regulator HydG